MADKELIGAIHQMVAAQDRTNILLTTLIGIFMEGDAHGSDDDTPATYMDGTPIHSNQGIG